MEQPAEDIIMEIGALSSGFGLIALVLSFMGAFVYLGWKLHPQTHRKAFSWAINAGAVVASIVSLVLLGGYIFDARVREDGWVYAILAALSLSVLFLFYPRFVRWVKKKPG